MPNSKYTLLYILALVTVLMTACKRQTIYNHYEHTPVDGWERNDTLSFNIGPTADSGDYQEEVGLRITALYPFMDISLVINQTILSTGTTWSDTLNCALTDEQGSAIGNGVSQYQYRYPLKRLSLNKGESLYITVRHDMKREILPGITDIGLIMRKWPSED